MISAEAIQNIILNNWNKQRAANFYIICSRSHSFLSNWMEHFCTRFLSQHLHLSPDMAQKRFQSGHPDLLWLSPPPKGHYKMEEKHLEELIRGQYFHPMELPRKLFIVADTHKIRQDYASKLLKTLEEPHPLSSIFFLNPGTHPMLPTIESRSILLRLPTPSSETDELSSIIDTILENCEDYAVLDELQRELDQCEASATFHNNAQARLFGLQSMARQYCFQPPLG